MFEKLRPSWKAELTLAQADSPRGIQQLHESVPGASGPGGVGEQSVARLREDARCSSFRYSRQWHCLENGIAGCLAPGRRGDLVPGGHGRLQAKSVSLLAGVGRIRQVPISAWVAGNHDWGLLGRLESTWFSRYVDGFEPNQVLIGDFAKHAWDVILQRPRSLEHQTALMDWFQAYRSWLRLFRGYTWRTASWPRIPWTRSALMRIGRASPRRAWMTFRRCFRAWQVEVRTWLAGLPRLAEAGWASPKLMLVGHAHKVCAWQPRNGERDGSRWADSRQRSLKTRNGSMIWSTGRFLPIQAVSDFRAMGRQTWPLTCWWIGKISVWACNCGACPMIPLKP